MHQPKSVAPIGASQKPGSTGLTVVGDMVTVGINGRMAPVERARVRSTTHVGRFCMIAVLALTVGGSTSEAQGEDRLIARGRSILDSNCARCHAVGPTGESALAAAPPFRTLSRKYPIEALAEALAEGIVTGHNEMPQFVFAPNEIDAILAYLNSINAPRAR